MAEPSTAIVAADTPALVRPVAKPSDIIAAHKECVALINEVLEPGVDIVKVPGTDKECLSKAGAERLQVAFGTHVEYEVIERECDHGAANTYRLTKWIAAKDPGRDEKERLKALGQGRNKKTGDGWAWQVPEIEEGMSLGLYRYVVRATCIQSHTGRILGTGLGSCSSLESKYIRSPRESENTILKIAKKRAYVDSTLTSFALSDRFTQDVEDMAHADVTVHAAAAPAAASESFKAGDWFKGIGGTKADFDRLCALVAERSKDPLQSWGYWFKSAALEGCSTVEELDTYLAAQLPPLDDGGAGAAVAAKPAPVAPSGSDEAVIEAEFVDDEPGKVDGVDSVDPGNVATATEPPAANVASTGGVPDENPFGGKYPGLGEYVDLTEAQYKKLKAAETTLGANLVEAASKCSVKTFAGLYEYMTGQAVAA